MLPVFWTFVRSYAPVIMLPVAAVIGIIGYNIENFVSDKYTPYKPSIGEQREDRLLEELKAKDAACQVPASTHHTLTEKKFVPKSIFERNLSPQLMTTKDH